MVPKAVLMKSSLVSVNIARQVNTSHRKAIVNNARPMTNLSKLAHSTDKNVNTAKPKAIVNVAKIKAVVNALKGNNVNAVKASAVGLEQRLKFLDHAHDMEHVLFTDYKEIDRRICFPLEVTPKDGKSKEGGLTCLFAKASSDESELWHKRLGHINFKTMNKLVKGNLVRGLPLELFEIHQTCVACQKGKQHRASCKSKILVVAGNQYNGNASTKACDDAGKARMKIVHGKDYILLPLWTVDPPFSQSSKSSPDARYKYLGDDEKKVTKEPCKEGDDSSKDSECSDQENEDDVNSTNNVNVASTNEVNAVGENTSIELPDDPNMHELEDIVYSDDNEDVSAEADMNNLDAFMPVSPIPTTRVHKDHMRAKFVS
ncbi:ribonuclease H-like domain-containing protein [Tanacetum coccineum]